MREIVAMLGAVLLASGVPKACSEPTSSSKRNPNPTDAARISVGEPIKGLEYWPSYVQYIQARILRRWAPPRGLENEAFEVLFRILPNGMTTNVRLVKRSNKSAAEQAGLCAIKEAAPFPHFPNGGSSLGVEYQLNFDSALFKAKNELPEKTVIDTDWERPGTTSAARQSKDKDLGKLWRYACPHNAFAHCQCRPYLIEMKNAVVRHWSPTQNTDEIKQVIVAFRLLPSGQITNLRIVHDSGNASLDESCLQAIKAACPFRSQPIFDMRNHSLPPIFCASDTGDYRFGFEKCVLVYKKWLLHQPPDSNKGF